eukprot:TRINITY_DN6914_c0_g1_i3.p1 TRINITY_DN6914_c0_g1~~TRINITY_DN6914_c0_g1_i3.p1  ORF type:complete len:1120 (-),score=317.69 TRINITY_DN6914_c0_g1_i3:144-3461(-)
MAKRAITALSLAGVARAGFFDSVTAAAKEHVNAAQKAVSENLDAAKEAAAENAAAAKEALSEGNGCLEKYGDAMKTVTQCMKDGVGQAGACANCFATFKTAMASCTDNLATKTFYEKTLAGQAHCEEMEEKALQAEQAKSKFQACGKRSLDEGPKLQSCVKNAAEAGDQAACNACITDYNTATQECPDAFGAVDKSIESMCASAAGAEASMKSNLKKAEEVANVNVGSAQDQVSKMKAQFGNMQNQAQQAVNAQASAAQEKVSNMKAQIGDMQSQAQQAANEQVGAAQNKVSGMKAQVGDIQNQAQQTVNEQVGAGQEKFSNLKAKAVDMQNQAQQAVNEQAGAAQEKVSDMKAQLGDMQNQAQQAANEQVGAAQEKVSDMKAQVGDMQNQAQQAVNEQVGAAQSQISTMKAQGEQVAEMAAQQAAATKDKLSSEIAEAKADLASTDAEEKAEEASKAGLANLEAQASAVEKSATDLGAPAVQNAEQTLAAASAQEAAIADKALASADAAVKDADKALKTALKSPNAVSFHFKGLDFKTADLGAFKTKLLDQFRAKGIPESVVSKLKIQFRQGSIIADVMGDKDSIEQVEEKAPSNSIVVDGVAAEVANPEDLCQDVDASLTDGDLGECWRNVEWAKKTGIVTQPNLYENYPSLSADSPLADFQYVLHRNQVTMGSEAGHDCPLPCSASSEMNAKIAEDRLMDAGSAAATEQEAQEAAQVVEEAAAEETKAAEDAVGEESGAVTEEASEAKDVATRAVTMAGPQLNAAVKDVEEEVADAETAAGSLQNAAIEAEKITEDATKALSADVAGPVEAAEAGAEAAQQKLAQALSTKDESGAEAAADAAVENMEQADKELGALEQTNTDAEKEPILEAAKAAQDAAIKVQKGEDTAMQQVYGAQKAEGQLDSEAGVTAGGAAPELFGTLARTTEAPSESWPMWMWAMVVAGVCCCMPLIGLACSAFICYESVAWIFGGSGKRSPQKQKKRGVNVQKQAATAAERAPFMDPQRMPQPVALSYQPPVVPTTVTATPVYYNYVETAQPAQVATYTVPATSYVASAAPAPVSYVPAASVSVRPAGASYVPTPVPTYQAEPRAAGAYTYAAPAL